PVPTVLLVAFFIFSMASLLRAGETARALESSNIFSQSLSMEEALNIALRQNSAILKGQTDLEAAYGIIIQTKAIALPKIRTGGNFTAHDPATIERFPSPFPVQQPDKNWTANIQLTQSIYEGGRINSALRSAKWTRQQAVLNYQTVLADALLEVRIAYDDTLLAAQQIIVQEASVKLLTKELEDTRKRFETGTVPRFNLLRAEVELANAKPRLIRAKNFLRISKNNLVNLLGYNLPKSVWEDIPLQLSDQLDIEPYEIELPNALRQALESRSELAALRQAEKLREESIANARAGYKPSVQLFAGYGARNSSFTEDLTREISGWFTGAQLSWDIFDGRLTKGKILEAQARRDRAALDLEDASRRIELEVRTAYSNFIEAREVLESQKKVQEQAEEALRLAEARITAGAATQLDLLSAQTALTESRTTQVQSLRDYSVARARLERAIGKNMTTNFAPPRDKSGK
ncbi:MAG: TolC family protein, partial [Limisphaerales bacterium]